MRILILNHFPLVGSGSGTFTHNLACHLKIKGHQPWVIAPGHQETFESFPLTTIYFKSPDYPPHPDSLLFNFPTFTIHSFSNTTFGQLSPHQRQQYFDAWQTSIEEVVEAHQPDIIHSQHIWGASYFAIQTGIPTVVSSHGTDLIGYDKYPVYREMAEEVAEKAAHIIVNSHKGLEWIEALYQLPAEKLSLIWNGYDDAVFRFDCPSRRAVLKNFGLSPSRHLVLFVGRLAEIKGVDILLEAATEYEEKLGDVQTLIVGAGELRSQLEAQAAQLQLKKVHFLGYQTPSVLANLYNIANLCVFPSHSEIFGLTALESLACGTPVVATAQGGFLDLITPDVGQLVPVDDANALADAIIHQIRNEAKRKIKTATIRNIVQSFSWSTQVDKMIEVYQQVIRECQTS
jgi:glycosyltransferase involved in cell wall biosynthesis